MKRIFWLFAIWVMALHWAHAASFDCAKARTKVEHLIFGNSELSKLDDELGKVYSEDLKKYPDYVSNFQHLQRAWLEERNKCKSVDCLRSSYQKRIAQLTPKDEKQSSAFGNKAQCLQPNIDWRDYEWTLITGKGQSVCEDMLVYLQSRPKDTPPPVCPEDRLPPNKDWSRPEARILSESEMQRLKSSIPKNMRDTYVGHTLKLAKVMKVIKADITRDGIPERLLAYSQNDDRKTCARLTQCAVDNEDFHHEIVIGYGSADYYDLLPMDETETKVNWLHPLVVVGPNPILMGGELIYYKGLPYWLSAPRWFQSAHDNFAHSRMRPNEPNNAMFKLNGIGYSVIGQYGGPVKPAPFSQVQHIRGEGAGCSFGYFRKENLKANLHKGKK